MGDETGQQETGQTDAERELLAATGRALAEHGVGGVTTQKIADEWGRAQSLVHYYYDTKEDLIVAYIEDCRAERRVDHESLADEPPLERLRRGPAGGIDADPSDEARDETAALLELHARALRNERYHEALNGLESDARAFLEETIRDGIGDGTFRDVDPREAAALLLSAADGGFLRTASLERSDDAPLVNAGVETYVERVLLTDEARENWVGFAEGS